MRKLATVRRISDIRPIPNADLIELAVVDGWQCVVKKGEFTVGELVIYCEVDTVLPVHPDYEFLRKMCYVQADWLPKGEGFRLRTMKLRGQVSQGLVLDPSVIPGYDMVFDEGQDVTDHLGIIKWDPPLPPELLGKARGRYPSYIPKTSQERVQNLVGELFPAGDTLWEVTLKLHGESCTFYHNEGVVGACSHRIDFLLDQEGNAIVDMFHRLRIADKLPQVGNIAVQGELMGPGIHGNREGFKDYQYYVYDIWDIDEQVYLHRTQRCFIVQELGLQMVPVIDSEATLAELECYTLEGMLQYADRPSINHKVAEGVVFKKLWGMLMSGEATPYSFKCINNRYLLGEK
jgi:RNA ligase (TIGR02306 family)